MDDTDDKNTNASNESGSQVVKNSSPNLINEGILAGQKIARISVVTLIGIGIVELVTGQVSGSVSCHCRRHRLVIRCHDFFYCIIRFTYCSSSCR